MFFFLLFLRAAWIGLSCYYLNPRRIRKAMLKQGVSGPEPRFLIGNLPDVAALVAKTTSSDMESANHDIVGRLMPHYVLWSKIYGNIFIHRKLYIIFVARWCHECNMSTLTIGKRFMYWYGSEPRFCLSETDLIKEFLSAKFVQVSGKSWLQQQGTKNFIGQGVLMANGAKWFHQRHVVAPAFMGDKLKVLP